MIFVFVLSLFSRVERPQAKRIMDTTRERTIRLSSKRRSTKSRVTPWMKTVGQKKR